MPDQFERNSSPWTLVRDHDATSEVDRRELATVELREQPLHESAIVGSPGRRVAPQDVRTCPFLITAA